VTGFKNRIINGAMVIDQRNAGASVTPNGTYTLDRWLGDNTQTSKFTVQQNAGAVTPPVGFTNYLGVTSSSAYSVLTGDTFYLAQRIEGYNIADLAWGTANAQTVTLSFWVRSSLTGTFGGSIFNAAGDRSYAFSYTINAANTWEYETITIVGDTTGTWLTTNGIGLQLNFGLGVGSAFSGTAGAWSGSTLYAPTGATSVVGTNGATFYITGVQLEVGTQSTSFEYRPYGTELVLCQRYAISTFPSGTAWAQNAGQTGALETIASASTRANIQWQLSTTMRAQPTVTSYNPSAANSSFRNISAGSDAAATINTAQQQGVNVMTTTAGATDNRYLIHLSATAEL
jgi:hypothetical protein